MTAKTIPWVQNTYIYILIRNMAERKQVRKRKQGSETETGKRMLTRMTEHTVME